MKYHQPNPLNPTSVPYIEIEWVPTVPNCHLAMTIALCIKTKLSKELPQLDKQIAQATGKPSNLSNSKIDVLVQDGKHDTKAEIDKQVNDKERVLAAMENPAVVSAIEDLIRERNYI